MKSIITSLALGAALVSSLSAEDYVFQNQSYRALSSANTEWTSLSVSLGRFATGFTPSAANLDLWSTNWLPFSDPFDSVGEYVSAPEWIDQIGLSATPGYAPNQPLYLWSYSSLDAATREWVLLTDPTWLVVANEINTDLYDYTFGVQTTALFGSINHVGTDLHVKTALAVGAPVPVPEPSTWAGVVFGTALAVFAAKRRKSCAN